MTLTDITERAKGKLMLYYAAYEDFAKLKAAAIKSGANPEENYFLDYAEPMDHRTGKTFRTLDAAVDWLKAEIIEGKSTFGCGDVYAAEKITVAERCTYCTCRGERTERRYVVTDAGIESEEAVSDCAWEND